MAIIMRHHPTYGLAIYDTPNPAAPNDAPMIDPVGNASVIKFHSNLKYPALKTKFDATVTLPAVSGVQVAGAFPYPGNFQTGTVTLGSHGQASVPVTRVALINFNGFPILPVFGTLPIDKPTGVDVTNAAVAANDRFFRGIHIGIPDADSTVKLGWFAIVPAGTRPPVGAESHNGYPSLSITVRVWIYDWAVNGAATLLDPAKPLLSLSGTTIEAGRGMFSTTRDYLLSGTGSDNHGIVSGAEGSFFAIGSPAGTATPSGTAAPAWSWRYSVDSYALQGQGTLSNTTTAKTVRLP